MKRMIRILMIAICCMVSCNMAANAGNDKRSEGDACND